jgi:hypothetical protein
MANKYTHIIMSCGYAEENNTSWLIYTAWNEGFDTMEEAIKELALDFYAKYYQDHLSMYENRYTYLNKQCCLDMIIKDHDAKFCSTCGLRLEDKAFDDQEYMAYIKSYHKTTCDSYGEDEYANDRELAWKPWGIKSFLDAPKESIIVIPDCAQATLTLALFDAKPELYVKDPCLDEEYFNRVIAKDWLGFKAGKMPTFW